MKLRNDKNNPGLVRIQFGRQASPKDEVIARFVNAADADLMVSAFNSHRLYVYLAHAQAAMHNGS